MGKSLLVCRLAATVSTGGKWPLNEGRSKRGRVVIVTPEDDTADTARPRLEVAGADLKRVLVLPIGTKFDLESGLERLGETIRRIRRVRMVIFDPATALLGSISRNNGDAIRALFTRLAAFATEHRLAVVLTAHLNKGKTVAGSFEWLAASRSAFLVARDPGTGRRLFVPRSSTLSKEMPAITFKIREKTLANGMVAPAVRWGDPIELSFEEALAATAGKANAQSAHTPAEHFLLAALHGGRPMKHKKLVALGGKMGLTPKMLLTARKSLKVVSNRRGGLGSKGWQVWSLPPEPK